MKKERISVAPEICSYPAGDLSSVTLDVSLPGVAERDIDLGLLTEHQFALFAPGEEKDFRATMTFCCPVELEGVRTRFENGLLRIQVPLQDTVYRYIPEGQALCEFGP
jgi:HSP20 family molecular chaperone IbpA